MKWRQPVFTLALFALTHFSTALGEGVVSVRGAWIREAPPGMATMAGYMELRNDTAQPQALVAASSSVFEAVMIHRTIVKDGMARMVHSSQVTLAPNGVLLFAPGDYHLMLMNPRRTLRAGDSTVINLEFRGGAVLPVTFEVRK